VKERDNGNHSHFIPMNDLKRHKLSKDCWCRPERDSNYPDVWVHNSADGREKYEAGGKMH
jgi:hypothetical protein